MAGAISAALDWWRDAGVDCNFIDDPQDWLAHTVAKPAPSKPVAAEPTISVPSIGGPRDSWPQTLESFGSWWLSEPSLAPARLTRLLPRGPTEADLMIVATMPQADDGDTLFSGRAGRMLDAMVSAMGLNPARVYFASALPARIALPDWAALSEGGLGAVLAHHIRLVAPHRLLVFGQRDISSLFGNNSAQNQPNLQIIDHEEGSVPAMGAADLDAMLSQASFKAQLWNRWLEWTGTEKL